MQVVDIENITRIDPLDPSEARILDEARTKVKRQ